MVVSGNDSIEFVVCEKAFLCLKQRQRRVESLYNVSVTSDGLEGELRWVKVNGEEKQRMKAKEYITSMGNPEYEKVLDIGQLSLQSQQANLRDVVFVLEQECSASIELIDKKSVRVSGGKNALAKAELYLNNLLSNIENAELELPLKRTRHERSSSRETSVSDDFVTMDPVDDLILSLGDVGNDEMIDTDASVIKENIDPMVQETSEDFAAKLGYSKDLYAQAVKKVGKEAGRNELLNELVKLKNSRKELNEEIPKERVDRRRSSISTIPVSRQLRPIIVDGSNVAMSHGKQKFFSCKGIQIAVDWFILRGHKSIYVVIPRWRKESPSESNLISGQEVLKILEGAVSMIYTPSRTVKQKRIACYDDRYILQIACERDGVVVSNDNFRDLYLEDRPEWKKIIEERVLMYSFVDDMFMPPDDPHGRNGPHIDELLSFGGSTKTKVCHYGRHCTYGRNCKYAHPERDEGLLRDTPSIVPRPYSEPVPHTDDDFLSENFKRLSMPDINPNQPPPIITRSRHIAQMAPALPMRGPRQHAPPLPPRTTIHGGIHVTENPYAPLPIGMEQQQMMYLARSQQPCLPPRRNQNYDALPFPCQMVSIPPHAQHHQYYNLPPQPGAYIANTNPNLRRGGPYDNLPPDGQMPVYPPRNHAIYQQRFYKSRAPPVDESEEDTPPLPERKQGCYHKHMYEPEILRSLPKAVQYQNNGTESIMHTMVNVAQG